VKKTLFEMGAKFEDGWSSDNKRDKRKSREAIEVKEPKAHHLYFTKEKRRGKIVTIVKPFSLKESDLKKVLKKLKSSIGSGGTIKDNQIEIQGEVKEKIKEILTKEGFRFKR